MCYYNQSPRYTLEQISTQQALEVFQSFINKYPASTRIPDANAKMDELRAKLRKKSYEAAYLYYKIQQYNAAVVALRNFLSDYPEYENPEKIEYLIVKALKSYADESTKTKKAERYTSCVTAYSKFVQKYPNSSYLEELNKLHKATLSNLENAQ
jgi:outer membrane protein assembly factor BamD